MSDTRAYLPHGEVAHLLTGDTSPNSELPAACGVSPGVGGYWFGTGTQDEYDRAERLPTCQGCERLSAVGLQAKARAS